MDSKKEINPFSEIKLFYNVGYGEPGDLITDFCIMTIRDDSGKENYQKFCCKRIENVEGIVFISKQEVSSFDSITATRPDKIEITGCDSIGSQYTTLVRDINGASMPKCKVKITYDKPGVVYEGLYGLIRGI